MADPAPSSTAASEWAVEVTNPDGIGWWLAESIRTLEAERDRYREALERIVSSRSGHLSRDALREIAREALAPKEGEGG